VIYTVAILAVLSIAVVYMISRKDKITISTKPIETVVTTAPEKQIVKPDDVIEEVIIGGSNDDVIGEMSDDYGPGMTNINDTYV